MSIVVAIDWDYLPPAHVVASSELDFTPLEGRVGSLRAYESGTLFSAYPIEEPLYAGAVGAKAGTYSDDLLDRIHLTPQVFDFGNIVGNAQRTFEIWNAFSRAVTLNSIAGVGTDGVDLTGAPTPTYFGPLQDRTYVVSVTPAGPPVLVASYTFNFSNSDVRTLTLGGRRIIAWQWRPNWERGILERLEFKTDILRSFNAKEQRRKIRTGARRIVEFDLLVTERERQQLETYVTGWQSRTWALPLWWSARQPVSSIPAGSTSITMNTAGAEFQAGGLAIILAEDGTSEVVEVQSVSGSALTLVRGTLSGWPATVSIFPAVPARLDQSIPVGRFDGTTGYLRARMTATEAATFTAAPPATTYLGYPIFTQRPMVPNEITLGLSRKSQEFDNEIAPPYLDDEAGLGLFEQSHGWFATNDGETIALRGLFFYLAGRYGAVWMPTWTDDLTLAADVSSGSPTIDVLNIGYSLYLAQQPGRNHIAIYMRDGSVLYRKLTGSVEVNGQVERLTISPSTTSPIPIADVLRISFMQLMRQSSDGLELLHWTGETMEVASSFVSFRHDL